MYACTTLQHITLNADSTVTIFIFVVVMVFFLQYIQGSRRTFREKKIQIKILYQSFINITQFVAHE